MDLRGPTSKGRGRKGNMMGMGKDSEGKEGGYGKGKAKEASY